VNYRGETFRKRTIGSSRRTRTYDPSVNSKSKAEAGQGYGTLALAPDFKGENIHRSFVQEVENTDR